MIIFGTKSTKGGFIETPTQCPFCGKEHAVGVLPYYKYFHVYWIPILPYGRDFITVCGSCGNIVPEHYLGAGGIDDEIKRQAKRPIWTYIGIIIIGAIVLFSVTMSAFK